MAAVEKTDQCPDSGHNTAFSRVAARDIPLSGYDPSKNPDLSASNVSQHISMAYHAQQNGEGFAQAIQNRLNSGAPLSIGLIIDAEKDFMKTFAAVSMQKTAFICEGWWKLRNVANAGWVHGHAVLTLIAEYAQTAEYGAELNMHHHKPIAVSQPPTKGDTPDLPGMMI